MASHLFFRSAGALPHVIRSALRPLSGVSGGVRSVPGSASGLGQVRTGEVDVPFHRIVIGMALVAFVFNTVNKKRELKIERSELKAVIAYQHGLIKCLRELIILADG